MSIRATIRRISETGEMEMDDALSDDADDFDMAEPDIEDPMDLEEIQDFEHSDFSSIVAEGLFRAGTPTPAITPPFPQVVLPPNGSNNDTGTASHGLPATFTIEMPSAEPLPLPLIRPPGEPDPALPISNEDTIGPLEDLLGTSPEIPTEQLDTECLCTS
jgi:hypothetical protein